MFSKSASFSRLIAMMVPALVQGRSVLLSRSVNVSTDVVCQSQYSWMNNSNAQSPCLVAAYLSGACYTGNWNVPVLTSGSYAYPSSTNASYCICSWAVYNLMGACTACQGSNDIDVWSTLANDCGNYVTNVPFPVDKIIPPDNILLPYWASINPTKWSNGRFDVDQALAVHNKNHSDINLSDKTSNTHKSKPSAGPIAGGVVAGVVVAIIAVIAIFLFMRRKHREKRLKGRKILDPSPDFGFNGHGRSLSDPLSQKASIPMTSTDNGYPISPSAAYASNGSSNTTLQTNLGPTNHSLQTNFAPTNTLPYDVSLIGGIPLNTPSPPPPSSRASVPPGEADATEGPENVIVPFTLTSIAVPTDRKRPDGGIYPIYEEPTAAPSQYQTAASRRRLNPPKYTESVDFMNGESSLLGSVAAQPIDRKGRARGPQNSIDSTNSMTTNTNTNTNRTSTSNSDVASLRTHMPPGSVSGLDDAMTQFGFRTASVVANGSAAISSPTGGRRVTLLSTDGSVLNGEDIA